MSIVKRILLMIVLLITAQISCRFLYFKNINKIAQTDDAYYLTKSDVFQNQQDIQYNYIWTKSSFLRQELSMVLKRLPIGGIGEHRKKGGYDSGDTELKKITGLYYFVLIVGIYFIFIFDFSLFYKKKRST